MSSIPLPKDLIEAQREQLLRLLKAVDNKPAYLAKMINVSPNAVYGWLERGRISKKGAQKVESNPHLGQLFTAKQLRPDL